MNEEKKCVLCDEPLDDKWGNNAQPLEEGQCCNLCNNTKVIPARIGNIKK